MLHLFDLQAREAWTDHKVDIIMDAHVIMFKFAGPTRSHVNADIELVTQIVGKYTQHPVHWRYVVGKESKRHSLVCGHSKDEESRHKLWLVRKNAYWAAKFAHPGKDCLITDVAGLCPLKHSNMGMMAWFGCSPIFEVQRQFGGMQRGNEQILAEVCALCSAMC